MSGVLNQLEVTDSIVLSSDNRTNAYYITSPSLSGGTSLILSLPPTQGTSGQVLTSTGSGNTSWTTPSISSGSIGRAIFSTSFIQSTESSTEYIQLAGNSSTDDVICRFIYPGSSIAPISNFACILSSGSSSPTGNVFIKNGSTTIATISFAGITSTPTIYSTSSISNVPSSTSILSFVINITGSSSQRVNVFSITIS